MNLVQTAERASVMHTMDRRHPSCYEVEPVTRIDAPAALASSNQRAASPPAAVIVGLEANGLGVARALARRGVECIAIGTPTWDPAYASRACRVVRCREWSADDLVATLLRVGRELRAKAPLLITKDEPVLWISAARAALSEHFEINLPSPDVVDLLMSKIRFTALAESEKWPIPKTMTIRHRDELLRRMSEVVFPCILKPAVKNSSFRAHAPRKAFTASTPEELSAAYESICAWEDEAVIQEWIPGGDERIAYCLAYYGRDGSPLAIFSGRKLRQRPPGCGNTAVAEPAPAEWRPVMEDLTRRVFAKTQFRGLGSLEFKVRSSSDVVIMEPTVGRTNWQNEIAVLNGVDIPSIAYFDMAGLPGGPTARTVPACKLVDGQADWRDLRELALRPDLTFARWLADRHGRKRFMLWRLDDPAPTLAAAGQRVGRLARYALKLPGKIVKRLRAAHA